MHRSEAARTREEAQARFTVLEGRVRFLECEMEVCIKRGEQVQPTHQHQQQQPQQLASPGVLLDGERCDYYRTRSNAGTGVLDGERCDDY